VLKLDANARTNANVRTTGI